MFARNSNYQKLRHQNIQKQIVQLFYIYLKLIAELFDSVTNNNKTT